MTANTNWLWNPEDMKNTPSIRAGMTMEQENKARREGINLIKEIGKAIGLWVWPAPQYLVLISRFSAPKHTFATFATACVFFHRFYMAHTFKDYPTPVNCSARFFKIPPILLADDCPGLSVFGGKGGGNA